MAFIIQTLLDSYPLKERADTGISHLAIRFTTSSNIPPRHRGVAFSRASQGQCCYSPGSSAQNRPVLVSGGSLGRGALNFFQIDVGRAEEITLSHPAKGGGCGWGHTLCGSGVPASPKPSSACWHQYRYRANGQTSSEEQPGKCFASCSASWRKCRLNTESFSFAVNKCPLHSGHQDRSSGLPEEPPQWWGLQASQESPEKGPG